MTGIVFFTTNELETLRTFYTERIGANIAVDQGDCLIFEKNDFNFAFCTRDGEPEVCGVLTFLFEDTEGVDNIYEQVSDIAESKPTDRSPDYNIYQFYAEDPEGRTLEFQTFLEE